MITSLDVGKGVCVCVCRVVHVWMCVGVWAGVYVCVCTYVYVRGERTCGLVFVHYQ